MDWKAVRIPEGSKLFRIHRFNFLHQGVNYLLEINELGPTIWVGHGEHATDQSSVIPSVTGSSMEDCISKLIEKINKRNT